LEEDVLEKLRHNIAHLGGNLVAAITRMGGSIQSGSPEYVVADTDFLRSPPSGSFRLLPT
jgi:hypothetical protein